MIEKPSGLVGLSGSDLYDRLHPKTNAATTNQGDLYDRLHPSHGRRSQQAEPVKVGMGRDPLWPHSQSDCAHGGGIGDQTPKSIRLTHCGRGTATPAGFAVLGPGAV